MSRVLATTFLVACFFMVATGCQTAGERPASRVRRAPSARDLAVAEAVFRHQFDCGLDTTTWKTRSGASWFLQIEGTDPPASFMTRFAGNEPSVRPGTDFREGAGILFNVSGIAEINATTVEVIASTHSGNVGGSTSTLRLELRGGTWFVTSDRLGWIASHVRPSPTIAAGIAQPDAIGRPRHGEPLATHAAPLEAGDVGQRDGVTRRLIDFNPARPTPRLPEQPRGSRTRGRITRPKAASDRARTTGYQPSRR